MLRDDLHRVHHIPDRLAHLPPLPVPHLRAQGKDISNIARLIASCAVARSGPVSSAQPTSAILQQWRRRPLAAPAVVCGRNSAR